MDNLDNYAIGFIKECYRQGIHEKQACALLELALENNPDMEKEAAFRAMAGALGTGVKALGGAAGTGLKNLSTALRPAVRTLGSYANQGMRATGEMLHNGANALGRYANSGIRSIGNFTGKNLNEFGAGANRWLRDAGTGIQRGLNNAGRSIKTGLRTYGDEFGKGLNNFGNFAAKNPATFLGAGAGAAGIGALGHSLMGGSGEVPAEQNPELAKEAAFKTMLDLAGKGLKMVGTGAKWTGKALGTGARYAGEAAKTGAGALGRHIASHPGMYAGAAAAGLGGYGAHKYLSDADNFAGRLYRRVNPYAGTMDLDPYEQTMVTRMPQKSNNEYPYAVNDWSRSGIYSETPAPGNKTNNISSHRYAVMEANKKREAAMRAARDEYGNVSEADKARIMSQFEKDKSAIVSNYNKDIARTNMANAKDEYHRNRAIAEASKQEANATRHIADGQDYGIFNENKDNRNSALGGAWETFKAGMRPIYSGLGFTNSDSDMKRYEQQRQAARGTIDRLQNATPLRTVGRANNVGDLY